MPEVTRPDAALADRLLERARRAVDLARAAGADEAEAAIERQVATDYRWRDGRLEAVTEDATEGLRVALYVDGRYSTHATNDLAEERLAPFLAQAVALTRHLEPDPHRRIPDPALYAGRATTDLDLVDGSVRALEREDYLALCRRLEEAARAHEAVVSVTTQAHGGHATSARATSNGFAGTHEATEAWFGARVTVREGENRRPEAHHFVAGTHREGLPAPEEVGAEALRRALARRGATKVSSRQTTLVLHPEPASSLVARALGALAAGAIQQRRSFLADRLGERVAAERLTITDEPLLARALASRLYDGEGIAARPRSIVEDGVLRACYVDTYYGRKLGWAPTTGSPSNVVLRPGAGDLDALLAGVSDGILVTSWLGGNANLTTGDFSFGVRGHRVRQGRIEEPVAEMNVTGSYPDLLARLVAVGDDPVPWFPCRVPTLVFEGVQFSGS